MCSCFDQEILDITDPVDYTKNHGTRKNLYSRKKRISPWKGWNSPCAGRQHRQKPSAPFQLFGQEDVNKKMDELEDGYTNISMPKRQKIVSGILAGFCVILMIIANSGILPSGEEDFFDETTIATIVTKTMMKTTQKILKQYLIL